MIQMGKRIHDMRKKWGYTLDEVAERVEYPSGQITISIIRSHEQIGFLVANFLANFWQTLANFIPI